MRILAIRGRNLASLAQDVEVDLLQGALAGAGLFAITGPVGAGKTTLLDAVCLALFDRTPRLSGRGGASIGEAGEDEQQWLGSNDVRTVLRRGATEGFAEVEFRGRDERRYRARWTVRRARLRRDGRVMAQELSLFDVDAGAQIGGGRKTEVLGAIQARLGLDFEQFCRSVLLAQGDFAAFLKAPPGKRAELLECMTGTDIYRRLSMQAFLRWKDEDKQAAELRAQVDALRPLDDAAHAALVDGLAAARVAHQQAQARVHDAEAAHAYHQEAERWRTEESKAVAALQAAVAADRAAEPRRRDHERLRAATALLPRREFVAKAMAAAKAAADALATADEVAAATVLAAAAARAEGDAATAALRSGDDRAAVAAWLAQHPHGLPLLREWAQHRGPLEQLAQLDRRAAALATAVAAQQAAAIAAERRCAELAAAAAVQATALAAAQTELQRAQAALDELPFADLQLRRRALHGDRQRLHALERALQAASAARAAVDAATAEAASFAAQRAALAEQGKALADASHEHTAALHSSRAQLRRLEAAVDLRGHRAALADGEPCPLCGALEHPAAAADPTPAHAAQLDVVAAAERAQATALQAAADNLAGQRAATAALAAAEQRAAAATRSLAAAAAPNADLAGDAAALDRQRAQLQAAERELEAAETRNAERRVEQERYAAALAAAGQQLRQGEAALQASKDDAAAHRGREQQLLAEAAPLAEMAARLAPTLAVAFDCDGWRSRLDDAQLRRAAFAAETFASWQLAQRDAEAAAVAKATAARAGDTATAALATARQELADAAATAGVDLGDVDRAAKRDAVQLRRDEQALLDLGRAVDQQRAVVQERTAQRQRHAGSSKPATSAEDAAAELAAARAAATATEEGVLEQQSRLLVDDAARRQHADLQPKLAVQAERLQVWAALHDLIGSASGDKFQVFAQGLTMDLLLAAANQRLEELARRYRLQRNRTGALDFVVVDLDLGASVRSIHTLSGGETFLVSLALALALATLAAPRARIETLFLDEGFGTLDAQSLETALAALDALQASGCQVGVISHVDGFAERIGAAVEVLPDGAGQSRVLVRA
jgi:exonuclease SbcC